MKPSPPRPGEQGERKAVGLAFANAAFLHAASRRCKALGREPGARRWLGSYPAREGKCPTSPSLRGRLGASGLGGASHRPGVSTRVAWGGRGLGLRPLPRAQIVLRPRRRGQSAAADPSAALGGRRAAAQPGTQVPAATGGVGAAPHGVPWPPEVPGRARAVSVCARSPWLAPAAASAPAFLRRSRAGWRLRHHVRWGRGQAQGWGGRLGETESRWHGSTVRGWHHFLWLPERISSLATR